MRRPRIYQAVLVVAIVLLGGWLWYGKVYQSPGRVFGDMLRANLSTAGVTKLVSQPSQALSSTQYTQLSLGARPLAHALTVFQQANSKLVTEEISTSQADYVRYRTIRTPKQQDDAKLAAVVGKWAKLPSGSSGATNALTSGLFGQSLLSVLPIANLNDAQRSRILATIKQSQVFTYDSAAVKSIKLAGRRTYQYSVSIKPMSYVTMMQQFERLLGASTYASVNPATYATAQPIAVTIDIDARSHQLAEIYQAATGRTERYEAFGVTDQVAVPKATITTTELTKRLAGL